MIDIVAQRTLREIHASIFFQPGCLLAADARGDGLLLAL
jgi:hypothetical protein